jgi:hypothetical protein
MQFFLFCIVSHTASFSVVKVVFPRTKSVSNGSVIICTDPDLVPDPFHQQENKVKKSLDFYSFVTS